MPVFESKLNIVLERFADLEDHPESKEAYSDAMQSLLDYVHRTDLIELTRESALRIQNGRTTSDIVDHLNSEVRELNAEMSRFRWLRRFGKIGRRTETWLRGRFPARTGPDGIVGEAVDILTCAIDLIVIHDPSITRDQIMAITAKKLGKWERRYSGSIDGDRSIH